MHCIDFVKLSLAIYDLAGHRVRTLVEHMIAAGSYQRVWDGYDDQGQSVGAGIYVVRLITEDYRLIRNILKFN